MITAERQGGETGTTCHQPHGKCALLTKKIEQMSDIESDLDGYDWVGDKVGLQGKLVPWSFSNSKQRGACLCAVCSRLPKRTAAAQGCKGKAHKILVGN